MLSYRLNSSLYLLFALVAALCCSGAGARASESAPGIAALVKSLAKPLKAANAKNVVVLDIRTTSEKIHPVGVWLADQISTELRAQYPAIHTIDRSQLRPDNNVVVFEAEANQARAVGADVAVSGDFSAVSNRIGISLTLIQVARPTALETRTGTIPISKEITDLTTEPLPPLELKDGFPQAGRGGISMPVCTHCPPPMYGGMDGSVNLEVIVTTAGRPDRIKVVMTQIPDLTALAIRSVQGWRFKPATGFDGKPVAVILPIWVTFK